MSDFELQIDGLFQRQLSAWPLLAAGVQAIRSGRTRRERIGDYEILLRHFPHRLGSVTAAVDSESVAARPCFLCAANLPPEEEGLAVDDDYVVYCNPFPILERHVSIVHRRHQPQRIASDLETLVHLVRRLPRSVVLYNGPMCGASAPDHRHFQAVAGGSLPLESDVAQSRGLEIPGYGRRVLVVRAADDAVIVRRLRQVLEVLERVAPAAPEPMLNIAGFTAGSEACICVFPRSRHRPQAFHTGEWTISPGAIDLCGVVVVPVAAHFERITAADVAGIFDEVTIDAERFAMLVRMLSQDERQ